MPIRDDDLDLSPNASDLPMIITNLLSANTLDLEGTPIDGLAVRLNIEYNHGSTVVPTFQVIIHAGSSTPVASSDPIVGTGAVLSCSGTPDQLEQIIPFTTQHRYVRAEFALGNASATDSPSFSVVEAYIVPQVAFDWTRAVNFH